MLTRLIIAVIPVFLLLLFQKRAAAAWQKLAVPPWAGWALFVLFSALYIALKFNRHLALATYGYDLSAHDYAFYNTLHGHFLYTSFFGQSYLKEHFFPALLMVLPFYAIHPSPEILLVIQAVMVAAAVVPFFKAAEKLIGDPRAALFLAIAFMLNPFMLRGVLFDFHIEMLQPLLLCGVMVCLVEKRLLAWCLLLLVLFCTKESEWLTGLMIALSAWLLGHRRFAVSALVISILAAGLMLWTSAHYATGFVKYLGRYRELGPTPFAILWHVLTHPGLLINAKTLTLAGKLLFPLAGLSLLSPLLLAAVPDFCLHMVSNKWSQQGLFFYYSATIVPMVFLAAAAGLGKVRVRYPRFLPALAVFLLVMNSGPVRFFSITQEMQDVRALAASLPPDGSVAAENEILPHLARQRQLECVAYSGSHLNDFDFVLIHSARWPKCRQAIEANGLFEKKGTAGNYVLYAKRGVIPPAPAR